MDTKDTTPSAAAAADAVPAVAAPVSESSAPSGNDNKKAEKKADAAPKTAKAEPADDKKKEKAKKQVEKYEFVNTTPAGEKKDLSGEMLPAYHPQAVEAAWNSWWEASGFFRGDAAKAKAAGEEGRFVMVIPPPNVTGSLHLGHALTSSIEDTMARWHRMNGRPVLWLPGTDHAGIATQVVVEKRLMREQGVSRHDLGRDAFVSEVWKWKETYGNRITSQLRHMGVSTDWSRERFTMDPMLSKAVTTAFVRLHSKGLIYRDTKLVNWCCKLRTAISDIEVEHIDIEKRTKLQVPGHDPKKWYEFGVLTSFAYKVKDSEEEIVVATTRPETMLGDVAVAVHPADPRYTHLVGKELVHPFFPERKVVVIADGELVDMSFGTGAVKITPAHDPNDYKCGKRHGLAFITVFTEDGKISANGGPEFAGMMRFDARDAVTKALEAKGLLRGKQDNKMRLGLCSRSGDVIEPLIKPQWYVSCADIGKKAADSVRSGELRLVPDMHEVTWYRWLDNIQDWCISRQLWWGHRIPAYLSWRKGGPKPESADSSAWVVAPTEDEARAVAGARLGVAPEEVELEQDEDVLDTWFSSGLFPFATMGWPDEEHEDFQGFFPNSILETGHDILFFWVARMVMMSIGLIGKLPFKTVYLHAMVRDKYGRKMSKSLGNVIDPMEVIYGCDLDTLHERVREGNLPAKEMETAIKGQKLDFPDGIPECGADALRLGLLAYTVQGRDINMDINRIVGYRQFCNKLWNATRFALTHLAADKYTPIPFQDMCDELATSTQLAARDRWVLHCLNRAINRANAAFKEYQFGTACSTIYDFWLYELCDWYLELIKPLMSGDSASAQAAGGDVPTAQRLSRYTLHLCLDAGLRLLHPIMPFVTEELWQRLPGRGLPWRASGECADPVSIVVAPYPTALPGADRPDVADAFDLFKQVVHTGRSLRGDADITPSKEATFYIVAEPEARAVLEGAHARDVATLLRASSVQFVAAQKDVEEGCSVGIVSDKVSLHLLLRGLVDVKAELQKLDKRNKKVTDEIARIQKKQTMASYVDRVPEDVRKQDTELLQAAQQQLIVIAGLRAQYESWLNK